METKILKSQGPGNPGDLGHPYFGGTIFPSSAFCDPQPLSAQYGTQPHNQTPETSSRGHGKPAGAGPTSPEGFSRTEPPMLRLSREFESTF